MEKYSLKHTILLPLAMLALIFSCQKDYPKNVESPDIAELKSIKIVNAGASGNKVLEGVIDENLKTIWFPRLDTLTDFSQLRFEAETSAGGKLEKETYDLDFNEGEATKTIVIKVVNNKRFKEYLATLRLIVPVYGADFGKPEVYDHTNNSLGQPIYPTFVSQSTRGSGFDGKHVLIVTRAAGGSHLLKASDLRNNQIVPITLNMTGVALGTFTVNCGAQINGHTYIANLSGGQASPFRIYHWTDPEVAPQMIADLNIASIPEAGLRHGDNMSVSLDENGNGFMFFGDNAVKQILRLTVTNYTTISNPTVLPNAPLSTGFMSYNRVGTTGDFIYTGYEAPIRVANESGGITYSLSNTAVPVRGSDARVFNFNGERYLMMTTAARSGSDPVVFYVYDITKGNSTTEALQLFDQRENKDPVFQYSLQGAVNPAPSTQTSWYVTKDADGKDKTLTLYTASTDAGFVFFDFPVKTLDD